jgi:hypothetical protein
VIHQTDKELGPYINKWGCFLISILRLVEKNGTGYTFRAHDILKIYENAMRHELVSREVKDSDGSPKDGCTILEQRGLYNMAAEMYGFNTRCLNYYWRPADYQKQTGEDEILELKRSGVKGSHFVTGNGSFGVPVLNRIEFDPIAGGSVTARRGWIESIRIFQTRLV